MIQKNSCHNVSTAAVFDINYSANQFIQQVFRHADIFLLLVAVNLALDGDVTFVTDLFLICDKGGVVVFALAHGYFVAEVMAIGRIFARLCRGFP